MHIFCLAQLQERLIKEYQPRCKEILTGFEKWLSNKKWFAGDNVSTTMQELLGFLTLRNKIFMSVDEILLIKEQQEA